MATAKKGKIGKEDIALAIGNDNQNTFNRRSATGGLDVLHRLDWIGIDVCQVYSNGSTRTDTQLNNAINDIGTTIHRTLWLSPGTWSIDNNLTIPSNICLDIAKGATLEIASGITLTVNGAISAGRNQIFTGSGSVAIGSYTGHIIMAYWFNGATMSGSVPSSCIYLTSTGFTMSEVQGDSLDIDGVGDISDTLTLSKASGYGLSITSDGSITGNLDVGGGTTRRVAPAGTFVNNTNGGCNISDTSFDIDANVTMGTWESFGPTDSGADNVWTALDSVPVDADWIEVSIYSSSTSTADTVDQDRHTDVFAREGGSSASTSAVNEIAANGAHTDTNGDAYSRTVTTHKISLENVIFDIYFQSTFSTYAIEMVLVGWGFNP